MAYGVYDYGQREQTAISAMQDEFAAMYAAAYASASGARRGRYHVAEVAPIFLKPQQKSRNTPAEEKENAVNPDTIIKLREFAARNEPVRASDSSVEGRLVRVHEEPVAVIKTVSGTEHYVPTRLVRGLSEEEMTQFLLREREDRAAQREQAALVAMRQLRELLAEATEDGAFGRIEMPSHVQKAINRLVEPEPYDSKLPDEGEA